MDNAAVLARLQQLIVGLQPAPGTNAEELTKLQRNLAEQIATNPDFTISGNRLHHEAAQAESMVDLSARFGQLTDLLTASPTAQAAGPPLSALVFRRDTPFSSNLLGNSVPQWASGMAPTNTFGDRKSVV